MINIGLIEDNEEQREQLDQNIKLTIEDDIKRTDINIISISPFADKKKYIRWIQENEISVILTDEKLYEIGSEYGEGHLLIKFLDPYFPGLKFFIITSYPEEPDLIEGQADSSFFIIDKTKFNDSANASYKLNLLHLIINSAVDFKNDILKDLKLLKSISEKIALGKASKKEIEDAKSIQQKLELPITAYEDANRKLWISEFEQEVNDFKKLDEEITNFLNRKLKK